MSKLKNIFLFILFLLSFNQIYSQTLSGYVLDQYNNPIPYAKVYVKNFTNLGAVCNLEGHYTFAIDEGNYEVIYSSLGYESQEINVTIKGFSNVRQDIYLKDSYNELAEVEINEKKRNVGYEIIKNVIANKNNLIYPYDSYSCDIYIKGTETSTEKNKESEKENYNNENQKPKDVFDEEQKEIEQKINDGGKLSMVEIQIQANFKAPNKIKEFRTAYSKVGNPSQIYLTRSPVLLDCNFNFYEGLIQKENLHETPIVSPIHASGILSYKYKLREIITTPENDTIYKIEVSPRSVGTSTLEGYVYVKKHEWVITKVELEMNKGNLKVYDSFKIIQEYEKFDSIWLVTHQTFEYETKYGKEKVEGKTNVYYSNYQLNPEFPNKFFNNELGVTTKEAYDKDNVFWDDTRPAPLTAEEQRKKFLQDSLHAVYTKKEYLDSIDDVFNKITFWKVTWFGIDHREREKKTQWYISSLAQTIEPFNIGGPRIGPSGEFFKKFENQEWIDVNAKLSMGYLNKDVRGYVRFYHLYNPKKFSTYQVYYSHDIGIINNYTAFLNYIDRSNYYLRDKIGAHHSFEVFNGFFINVGASNEFRRSLENFNFYTQYDTILDIQDPISFEPYTAFRTTVNISYTPGQKFVTEPYRKVILGSKWPTFRFHHEKGWNKVLGSVVDFDYISFTVDQELNIGTLGKTNWRASGGAFINQDSLHTIDYKFFRDSDVGFYGWVFSNPLYSFQNLSQQYETRDWYLQVHAIHHFNGAIINKIPFMKKTGIKEVMGGGILYLPEYNNMFYQEFYLGIERIFKLLRRRIRIGSYIVVSDSNVQPARIQYKISFDVMNEGDLKFNF